MIDIKLAPKSGSKLHTGVNKGDGVLVQIEVMVSLLDLVLGGIRVMLLIRATGCPFESLE